MERMRTELEPSLRFPIKLSAIVDDVPVLDGDFEIPVRVEEVRIYESPMLQRLAKEGAYCMENLRSTRMIRYSSRYGGLVALPIFRGDRIDVYTDATEIPHKQGRFAYVIELLDEKGKIRAVYKNGNAC